MDGGASQPVRTPSPPSTGRIDHEATIVMPLVKPRTAAPDAGSTGRTGSATPAAEAGATAPDAGDAVTQVIPAQTAEPGTTPGGAAQPGSAAQPGGPAQPGGAAQPGTTPRAAAQHGGADGDAATQALPTVTPKAANATGTTNVAEAANATRAATAAGPANVTGAANVSGTTNATRAATAAGAADAAGAATAAGTADAAGAGGHADAVTEVTPTAARPLSDDTVILPALRGRTTKQERERPPTNRPQPAAPAAQPDAGAGSPAPGAPDHDRPEAPETPRRRGPSRAMAGVGVAVVLIVAAAWLLVSLPGAPGGADWAGGGDRNWPPGAPGGTPSAEQPLSAPPASAPFESPEPGRPTDNGLVATPPSPGAAAAKPAVTTPAAGASPSDAAPTTGAPAVPGVPTPTSTSPLHGGNGGNGIALGQIEAESFAWQWGVTATALDGASGGRGVSAVSNGDWLRFDGLNFGGGVRTFKARIANGSGDSGRIEIRYDSPWSSPVASVSVDNTGGWSQWRTRSVSCTGATGSRTIYVSFVSRSPGDFVYLDWISFA